MARYPTSCDIHLSRIAGTQWISFLTIIIILRTIIILGELANSGQPHNLMSTTILRWESTTTAGIQVVNLVESGATPLIQISGGSSALFQSVRQLTTARKVIHLVQPIVEA